MIVVEVEALEKIPGIISGGWLSALFFRHLYTFTNVIGDLGPSLPKLQGMTITVILRATLVLQSPKHGSTFLLVF